MSSAGLAVICAQRRAWSSPSPCARSIFKDRDEDGSTSQQHIEPEESDLSAPCDSMLASTSPPTDTWDSAWPLWQDGDSCSNAVL